MASIRYSLLVASLCTATSVATAQTPDALFSFLPPSHTGITFANTIIDNDYHNIIDFIYAYNGSGVAVGDVNGDRLPDLFFSGTQVPNKLYVNRGDFRFEDVSVQAGVSDTVGMRNGVSMVDIDADGDLDIYVSKQEHPNTLFINDGSGVFTERAREFGLAHDSASTNAAFLDYDRDGDLDVYLIRNGDGRGEHYVKRGLPDKMYRNNGNGTFTDVSIEAGIWDAGYGLSATVGDVNNDGWQDIFVANDFEARSLLWMNNGDGTFTESMKSAMSHSAMFAMGTDIADFNNDGHLDMVEVDMLPDDHERKNRELGQGSTYSPLFDSAQHMRNCLYLNRGNGTFSEIGFLAGVAKTDWSWASLFADFDLDGWKDLFIANGLKRDLGDQDYLYSVDKRIPKLEMLQKMPVTLLQNYMFRNRSDLTFEDVSTSWGLPERANTQGAAYADLDLDGDLDLVLNSTDTVAFVYRNNAVEQKRGNWLRVKVQGPPGNPSAIGARVTVVTSSGSQLHEVQLTRGYLSSVEPVLYFGLGAAERADVVAVAWPTTPAQGAMVAVARSVPANTTVSFSDDAEGIHAPRPVDPSGLVSVVREIKAAQDHARTASSGMVPPADIGIDFRHVENPFSDFDRERLLPNRLSTGGPGIAVGDVDGNGYEDVYIGGAKFQTRALYLQKQPGAFVRTEPAAFAADERSEDMGALFFDADGDRDLDLYVVSGGTDFNSDSRELQDRLYINNGKGEFAKDSLALPLMLQAGSSVVAVDYDGDGDLDLFVAGRAVPGRYPLAPRSYLLKNTKGSFKDVTSKDAPSLLEPGMISSALWSDYDNDGDADLLLAGEWMTPRVHRNDRGRLVDATSGSGLDSSFGWWTSIAPGDFDNDGDIDYVFGNWGRNTRYQPTASEPIELFAHDFDGNGSLDPIMTYYYGGKRYPTRDKPSFASQIPSISRRFPKFYQYARATVDQLLPKDSIVRSRYYRATTFESSYVENLGGGRFQVRPLPLIAQAAPIFGIAVEDVDGDDQLDLLITGNFYGPEPEMKRYDGLGSMVLTGDGSGGFRTESAWSLGFDVMNNPRAVARVANVRDNATLHIVSTCNDRPYVYRTSLDGRARLVEVDHAATHAVITLADGSTRRHEFPLGAGYLSQWSSSLSVPTGARLVTLYSGTRKLKDIRQ